MLTHDLAIFDNGNALALYHTKRLASPAQRIVLYAKNCSGCALLGETAGDRCESRAGDPASARPSSWQGMSG